MLRINEIFYSIQGEGRHAGRAAVFVRFAGCNLKCPFCDTNHQPFVEMTEKQVADAANKFPTRFVVLTGGEPTLQLNKTLIDCLHDYEFQIAIETNGTRKVIDGVDWVTVSPKTEYLGQAAQVKQLKANEIKIIVDENSIITDGLIDAEYYYIQPCDTGDAERNKKIIERCINIIKANPQWKLSIQLQKILRVQ